MMFDGKIKYFADIVCNHKDFNMNSTSAILFGHIHSHHDMCKYKTHFFEGGLYIAITDYENEQKQPYPISTIFAGPKEAKTVTK